MSSESYKAWIDAMPIDEVRQKIARLERKLADLHVLERLYEGRHGGAGSASATEPEGDGGAQSAPDGDGEAAPEQGSEAVEGGGGWTQGEASPEHG